MLATIYWDQTLLSAAIAAIFGAVAYAAAARVLRRQERLRELRLRRDALDQVLALLEGDLAEYLARESPGEDDYPQREMVELERRVLQAQILYWRDLEMQQTLRDMTYPNRHAQAAAKLRGVLEKTQSEMRAAGGE